MKPIILLDLNFTLVANSRELGKPFLPTYPVEDETYRNWLVELLRPYRVELITARPTFLEDRSIFNIRKLCAWTPAGWHFNPERMLRAPRWKDRVLRERIFPFYGESDPSMFLALESNQDTRAMYASHGIHALPVPTDHAWSRLPDLPNEPPEIPHGQQTIF